MHTEPVLVVDFGTSASSAVLVADGMTRPLKEPGSGSYSWPSVVSLDGSRLLIGVTAERRKRKDPAGYRAEFKRDLGERAPIPLGDRSFPVEDLVSAVLSALRRSAADLHGAPVGRAVLTVPASYADGDGRRDLMIAAAEAAGFAEVDLLPEPVAAALAPVSGRAFAPGDLVLVYDFGGGTFDAALVRFTAGAHEVLGHAALDDCGGRDIDALLAEHVRTEGGADLAESLDDGGSRMVRLRLGLQLSDFARGVKHQLSDVDDVEDFVTPAAPPSQVTRAELAALVAPLLDRTVECCRALLRRCGVAAGDVTAVLLVGGTSRMPAVAKTVTAGLGRPVRRPEDPDLAVVQGAAALELRHADRRLEAGPDAAHTRLRWDVPGGAARLLRILAGPGTAYRPGDVLAVARDTTGRLRHLAAPPAEGTIEAWDVEPGQLFGSTDHPARVTRAGSKLRVVTTPRELYRLQHDSTVHDVAFSPDGERLATGSNDRTAGIWDAATGRQVRKLAIGSSVYGVAFSPDGRWVASTSERGHARLHDAASGKLHLEFAHGTYLQSAAFSPDGARLVAGGWRRSAVVYDIAARAERFVLTHDDYVEAVAFAPDGRTVATASRDKTAAVWDTATGERLLTVRHTDEVHAVAYSPDGRWLATGSKDKTLGVWDTATGRQRHRLQPTEPRSTGVLAVAFSPDGHWLAAGGDGLSLFDTATGERLYRQGFGYQVNSLAFSPDGRRLAIASSVDARVQEIAT